MVRQAFRGSFAKQGRIAAAVLAALLFVSVTFLIWTQAVSVGSASATLAPPSVHHWLGTDRFGRDVLAVTLAGFGYTAVWALMILGFSVVIGVALAGISASYFGTGVDRLISACSDGVRSFPAIVVALLFVTVGVPAPLVLVLYFWVPIWRVLRARLATQRNQPYVLGARLLGQRRIVAVLFQGLPNVGADLYAYGVVLLGEIIAVQAGLDFLGFGPPLSEPTFGNILSETTRVGGHFWWVWAPSAMLAVVLACLLIPLFNSLSAEKSIVRAA